MKIRPKHGNYYIRVYFIGDGVEARLKLRGKAFFDAFVAKLTEAGIHIGPSEPEFYYAMALEPHEVVRVGEILKSLKTSMPET